MVDAPGYQCVCGRGWTGRDCNISISDQTQTGGEVGGEIHPLSRNIVLTTLLSDSYSHYNYCSLGIASSFDHLAHTVLYTSTLNKLYLCSTKQSII